MDVGDLLAPFSASTLELLPAPACAVLPDLSIAYVNPAWTAFGLSNGLTSPSTIAPGASVLAVTPASLRPFYARLFERARQTRDPVDHDYECSSPELHRVFRMRIHPCASGAFLIVHSLLRQEDHEPSATSSLEDAYRDARTIIVQCSNCRRVRRPGAVDEDTAEWDWVPAFVRRIPPQTSHGICGVCVQFYYSDSLPAGEPAAV